MLNKLSTIPGEHQFRPTESIGEGIMVVIGDVARRSRLMGILASEHECRNPGNDVEGSDNSPLGVSFYYS